MLIIVKKILSYRTQLEIENEIQYNILDLCIITDTGKTL